MASNKLHAIENMFECETFAREINLKSMTFKKYQGMTFARCFDTFQHECFTLPRESIGTK